MSKILGAICAGLIFATIPSAASAAPKTPPKPTGPVVKTGDIKGESVEKKRDTINVLSAKRATTGPRDAASGLPTGKRQH